MKNNQNIKRNVLKCKFNNTNNELCKLDEIKISCNCYFVIAIIKKVASPTFLIIYGFNLFSTLLTSWVIHIIVFF